MGFEPEHAQWPPLRLARVSRELVSVVVVSPLLLREFNNQEEDEVRSVGRSIGLDVHRDFCEVAIAQDGEVRSCGRIATTPEELELFGASLHPRDRVALEVSGSAWEVARILERHVARVVVVSPADTGIRQARAKNEIHAVLVRRLVHRPPVSDLFGVKGRRWLAELDLPLEESETIDACLRHIEFLDLRDRRGGAPDRSAGP